MSEVASTPSTPGSASAARSRSSRSVRLFMAVGRDADAEGAAGGVVGGDDHQPAVAANCGPDGARLPRPLDCLRVGRAHVGDLGVVLAHCVRH